VITSTTISPAELISYLMDSYGEFPCFMIGYTLKKGSFL